MSECDLINFLSLSDLTAGTCYRERLKDLQNRARYLTEAKRRTLSFYQFLTLHHERAIAYPWRQIGINTALGAGAMGLLGFAMAGSVGLSLTLPLVFSGALAGCALGALHERQEVDIEKLLMLYEHYLQECELLANPFSHISATQKSTESASVDVF